MKIVKLFAFEQVYPKLKELPLNIKTSYTLSKIHQLALLDIEFYKNSLSNIINKYGQRDEEGNLKVAEDNFIPIIEGELERCQKEIRELENLEIYNYDSYKISIEDLINIELSPEDLDNLSAFLKEE